MEIGTSLNPQKIGMTIKMKKMGFFLVWFSHTWLVNNDLWSGIVRTWEQKIACMNIFSIMDLKTSTLFVENTQPHMAYHLNQIKNEIIDDDEALHCKMMVMLGSHFIT